MERAGENQVSPSLVINKSTVQGDGNIVANTGSGSTVNITTCPQNVQEENNSTARSRPKTRQQISQCAPTETTNVATIIGDGSIVVNAGGSNIHVNVTTCPQYVSEGGLSTGRQACTCRCKCQQPSQNSQHEESRALVPVVPKPVSKRQRLNTKTCFNFIDNLGMLSVGGKIMKCDSIIAKLMKTKSDPDSQVSLRHAGSLNAIYGGDFKKANRLLYEVQAFLPDTRNEEEHRLWWGSLKSLAKLREGSRDMGIALAEEALSLLDTVAPGCKTAWLLINHAFLLTEIAAGQDDDYDRRFLMKKAETRYQHAIEHAENEHPKQMLYSQLRVPRFAKIGLALLHLGCRELVDNSRLGVPDISLADIRKAKTLIAALDKEGTVCILSEFLLMVAKTCLQYRLHSYQQAYDLAQEAQVFATEHPFGGLLAIAGSIVQYLKGYV